jgi:hypothetical protein
MVERARKVRPDFVVEQALEALLREGTARD